MLVCFCRASRACCSARDPYTTWPMNLIPTFRLESHPPHPSFFYLFAAACSKRGVLFILLLGFNLQSILITASPFFNYWEPTWDQVRTCFVIRFHRRLRMQVFFVVALRLRRCCASFSTSEIPLHFPLACASAVCVFILGVLPTVHDQAALHGRHLHHRSSRSR